MSTAVLAPEAVLADEVAAYVTDPLGWVYFAFQWGSGPLKAFDGPDKWQQDLLGWLGDEVKERGFNGIDPVRPIRCAVSSGHGVGKSTLAGWLVSWIMSTRPQSRGTVTANSWDQLHSKTWASVQRWMELSITAPWFSINSAEIRHKAFPKTWQCAASGSKEENADAFQGQHAVDSTSFYIFDEDSGIGPRIHEASMGGLTDGHPMVFRFGNCTRNTGPFYEACFGRQRDEHKVFIVDSREVKITNKALFEEWEKTYGEDSDFFRVRVRGLPPRASELQFIDQERVWEAQRRSVLGLPDEPIIAGLDVSDGGAAWNVVRFRRGMDARSIPPIRIPGEAVRNDRGALLAVLTEVMTKDYGGERVAMLFVDSAFGGPYVERLHTMGHMNVQEVRFGGQSPDAHFKNMRAYIWGRTKEWLLTGAIDDKDTRLETDLTGPGYHLDQGDKLVIEAKESMAKRGVDSPDDGDALALTFASNVTRHARPHGRAPAPPTSWAAM